MHWNPWSSACSPAPPSTTSIAIVYKADKGGKRVLFTTELFPDEEAANRYLARNNACINDYCLVDVTGGKLLPPVLLCKCCMQPLPDGSKAREEYLLYTGQAREYNVRPERY